jgi:hypothetical protein
MDLKPVAVKLIFIFGARDANKELHHYPKKYGASCRL